MEPTIDKHIGRLLFDHECVVVPGFGAFLTRHYPAEINSATHMMRPPSRRVSFNSRIKENDGLLAKYISIYENRSYNEALDSISIFVRSWKRILKTGKKVNLPGIGRLYLDKEEKIQFNPAIDVNYDKSSFGLSIFRSPAVHREAEIKKSVQRAIDLHIPPRTDQERQRRALPFLRWAAVLAPFLALGVTAAVYLSNNPGPYHVISGFNPFNTNEAPQEQTLPEPALKEVTETELSTPIISDEAPYQADESSIPVEEKEVPVKAGVTPKATQPGSHHIIVGSFKEAINAQNYVAELQSRGYDAYLAAGDARFNRVAIGNYRTAESAHAELSSIKSQVNAGAWVYSN